MPETGVSTARIQMERKVNRRIRSATIQEDMKGTKVTPLTKSGHPKVSKGPRKWGENGHRERHYQANKEQHGKRENARSLQSDDLLCMLENAAMSPPKRKN